MNSRAYFRSLQDHILAAPNVVKSNLSFDEISESECYIKGSLTFTGGFELFLAEYVITEPEIKRLKYRYHLQTANHVLIARWDNAPHHSEIKTHPNHFHLSDGEAHPSPAMDMTAVLKEIVALLYRDA